MRQQQQRESERASNMQSAFTDLSALMEKAKDMVYNLPWYIVYPLPLAQSLAKLSRTSTTRQTRVNVFTPRTGEFACRTGEFACRTGQFACRTGEFACRTGEFACRTGEFACRTGEFACRTAEFACCTGEFVC
eukprot:910758-Prorocentrum_minimum.AAC.1